MTSQIPHTPDRTERVLAYAIAALVGLSLIAFIAVLAGTAAGVGGNEGFTHGIWPVVLIFPLVGLPLGFLLVIILLVLNAVRRGRAARVNRS